MFTFLFAIIAGLWRIVASDLPYIVCDEGEDTCSVLFKNFPKYLISVLVELVIYSSVFLLLSVMNPEASCDHQRDHQIP